MSSGTILDTLQDKQMLDLFLEAKRGGICRIKGDIKNSNKNINIWYIDADNLYGYAMMQKLHYKNFKYCKTSLDNILSTVDDSDYDCYMVCDIDYINDCRVKTEQLSLMPNNRKMKNNELDYSERAKGRART